MSNKVNLRNITPGGASTSVVSPITTTYEGSFAGEYIAAAILSGNTLASDVITIKPNVKYKQVVKKLDWGSIVADATCDFSSSSNAITLSERVLTCEEFQVNLQMCKADYYSDYIGQEMAMSAYADLPASFADFLIAQVAAKVAESVESSLFMGATANPGEFDGFVTILEAGTTNDVTATTVTSANVITELGKIVDAIPSAVYGKEDLYLYISQNMARAYVRALGGFAALQNVGGTDNVSDVGANGVNNQGTTWYNGGGLSFDGVKIFVANGLSDNNAIAAQKSNLFFGTGLLEDHNEVRLIDTSETLGDQNVRMIMRYTAGAQVGVTQDCVLYN
jgi:hypothetical protein